MSKTKITVPNVHIDGANSCTLTIDRDRGTVTLRPTRKRHTYTLLLREVAEMIAWRCAKKGIR